MSENGKHEQPIETPHVDARIRDAERHDYRLQLLKENRKLEEMFLRRIDELRGHGAHDPRWLAQAKNKLEEAFMCLTRAIENPQRLQGELDD